VISKLYGGNRLHDLKVLPTSDEGVATCRRLYNICTIHFELGSFKPADVPLERGLKVRNSLDLEPKRRMSI
jgi:hypothetical protein